METPFAEKTADEVRGLIDALDLEPIKVKLMDKEEGKGWTLEQADEMEVRYKQFLVLTHLYPDRSIVPSKSVDAFWHYHILDTQKYSEDCQKVFGAYLHHFPYFGMRGKDDAAHLARAAEETRQLYIEHFGEAAAGATAGCDSSSCSNPPNCKSSCSGPSEGRREVIATPATIRDIRSSERPRIQRAS